MSSVMTQIVALTYSLAQNDIAPIDAPDDVIDIKSDISVGEDEVDNGDSGNYKDVEVKSADDQDPCEHVEEVEDIKGDKNQKMLRMTSLRMGKFPMNSVKIKK